MTDFDTIQKLEDRFQLATYKKMAIAVERGNGSWVWTSDGKRYLDLYGGHAVCATGHSHPRVVEAIRDQAGKLLFYSNLVYSDVRGCAAQYLAAVAPGGLEKVFFCNSGTEANENAMRMARLVTGRQTIVSFSGGFHGRTADSISATFLGKYRELGRPNVPQHVAAEFGDIDSVCSSIDAQTAAVIVEPIQSMAGVREAEPQFFADLREVCDRNGSLLIFDEIQSGLGRTGNWFFAGSPLANGAVPDVITLAKSLGSGVPVGACVTSSEISRHIKENDLGTTFGGGMIAMAAVIATLEVISEEKLIDNAKAAEQYLRSALGHLNGLIRIRGKGCLIGLEFTNPCSDIHARLLERGIIAGTSSDPKVLRLLPPLSVDLSELEIFVQVLCEL